MPRSAGMTERSRAVTRREAGELLSVSVKIIDEMCADGRLRRVIVGKRPRITMASIDAVLDGDSAA